MKLHMFLPLSRNKIIYLKQALVFSACFFALVFSGSAQKWEGLGLGDIGLAYFNHLSVDTAQDKLVLGATSHLHEVNGVSSCTVLKWQPETGIEILSPFDLSQMGVGTVQDVLFSHDSMIVIGDFAISIYKNGQWIYNFYNRTHSYQSIIPFNSNYLIATGYSYFRPLKNQPLLLQWDGDTTFLEYENITDETVYHDGVFTSATYKNELYVGGTGYASSGSLMNGIMKHDGISWQDVGGGITDASSLGGINDIIEYNGDLYFGGMFHQDTNSMEQCIARWDGQEWKTVGGGIGPNAPPGSQTIDVMQVHDGYLYVAGAFRDAGGVLANSIARWDGKEWCGCGSVTDGQITAMTFYRDTLYIGGSFNYIDGDSIAKIARFIGTEFADTCGSINVGVKTIAAQKKELVGYPNPVQETLTLKFPNTPLNEVTVLIFSSMGQLVREKKYTLINHELKLNLNQLTSGMYFGEVQSSAHSFRFSFVKE